MVTATGRSEVTVVPTGWAPADVPAALAEYVEPANGKTTSNATPAGCPIRSWVGVMVIVVLSSVATTSKPDGEDVYPLLVKF